MNYFIGAFMTLVGVSTTFISSQPAAERPLDALYGSHWFFVVFGAYIAGSGLILFAGQIMKRASWVGIGLFTTFTAFVFASVIQAIQFEITEAWLGNLLAAGFIAILYLRWRIVYARGKFTGLSFHK